MKPTRANARDLRAERTKRTLQGVSNGKLGKVECRADYGQLTGGLGYSDIGRADPSDARYWVSDYLGYSDYSGSQVERANVACFLERFGDDHLIELRGGHGTFALAIHLRAPAEVWKCLEGLENYPCLDDEALSELETAAEDEAWTDSVESDFRRELAERWDIDLDEVPAEPIRTLFETLRERANEYWYHETGGDCGIRLERLGAVSTAEEVRALPGSVELPSIDDPEACLARILATAADWHDSYTPERKAEQWAFLAEDVRQLALWVEHEGTFPDPRRLPVLV